jgi:Mg-chelatase subunit ChlD
LIRALAQEGVEGARALLAQRSREDPTLAQRLADLRERLRRQASRRVGRVLDEYDRRAQELETVEIRQRELLDEEIARLEERLRRAREIDLSGLSDPNLLAEVTEALLVPTASWMRPETPPGFWERLKRLFARIAAFFRRLFGRGRRGPPAPREGRTIPIATLAAQGRPLGASAVAEALARLSPPQRDELRDSVERTIQRRERDVEREAEAKRREAEAQRRALEAERDEARARAEREVDRRIRDAEEKRVDRELKERGLVAEREGRLSVTYGLVERFARLLLEEESRNLPASAALSLKGGAATGIYEKALLRQPEEVAHLDIPSSLLAARMEGSRHIDERTSYIYREVTSERVHVVLALDKSGSMAEGDKLPAAKKALLALYTAIRRKHSDAAIDVVAFDNDIRLLDLLELWECPPGSFTNTGEALRTAHLLLRSSRATRKEIFLITDGLPEAYTDAQGRVRSGNLDAAMEYTLARATELRTVQPPVQFTMVLIRSDHPEYEKAARMLVRTLGGELVVTDPQSLGFELLVRWASGSESIRRPRATAGAPASPSAGAPSPRRAGAGRGRRRRADRRMGG